MISSQTLQDTISSYLKYANSDSISHVQRRQFTAKVFDILTNLPNDSLNRVNYFKVANRYYNIDDFHSYKNVTDKVVLLSERAKDSQSLAKGYTYLGDYYGKIYQSDSAFKCYYQAEKLYRRLNKTENIAQSLLNKAIIQHNEGDLTGSEKSALDALKVLRSESNDLFKFEAYTLLGIISSELEDVSKGIYYNHLSLKIAEKGNIYKEFQSIATALNNIGFVYQENKQYDSAYYYYDRALREPNIRTDKIRLYVMLKDNMAYSAFKCKKPFNPLPLFMEALKIRDSLQIVPGVITSKLNLSEYYEAIGKKTSAKVFALDALDLAKRAKLPKSELRVLMQLSEVEKNKDKVESYYKDYIEISDSIQLAERKSANKFARIEFETEELTLEKGKLEEQRKTLIYIGLGLLVIGGFIFVIRTQASKNRELVLIQEQQRANEEVYQLMLNQQERIEEVRQNEKKRIAQELHDGVLGKLFGTRMNLGVLNAKSDEQAIASRVSYIDELKNVEQEIREISHDLSAEKAAIFNNFVVMVNHFIEGQRTVCKAEIQIRIDDQIDWNTVNSTAKINLYRILQEAFQNVNKHANAQHVFVRFFKDGDDLKLEVKDDGVGFNYARKKKGIGLINMNNRITNSKGTMEIETTPGNGTLLKFVLPLSDT